MARVDSVATLVASVDGLQNDLRSDFPSRPTSTSAQSRIAVADIHGAGDHKDRPYTFNAR